MNRLDDGPHRGCSAGIDIRIAEVKLAKHTGLCSDVCAHHGQSPIWLHRRGEVILSPCGHIVCFGTNQLLVCRPRVDMVEQCESVLWCDQGMRLTRAQAVLELESQLAEIVFAPQPFAHR